MFKTWLILSLLAYAAGFILDLIFGDPQWEYHPVRLIGRFISMLERKLLKNPSHTDRELLKAGIALEITVCAVSYGLALCVCLLAWFLNPLVYFIAETIFCYFLLATKSLKEESMKVYGKISAHDLIGGRQAVSMIVGRDTMGLNEKGVIKAAVETVAENTSDGTVAPMFYMIIGGAPLGFLYKAVNTLDSMAGYKNEKYMYFGRAAAKTDDVFNYIPARLSSYLMIFASLLLRMDWHNAVKIYRRDRLKHESPNSAHTESVCAGALDVKLAGDAYYFGRLRKKDFLGDDIRPVEPEDIIRANKLLYCTAVLAMVLFSGIKLLIGRCILW